MNALHWVVFMFSIPSSFQHVLYFLNPHYSRIPTVLPHLVLHSKVRAYGKEESSEEQTEARRDDLMCFVLDSISFFIAMRVRHQCLLPIPII